ncbi:MAG: T9SS type A sorting domain-containing protein, partial [Flavobacteriales bacterium]|nr:T9SS type A sorting domain-containing protein [Flavobacteriales bacterium]
IGTINIPGAAANGNYRMRITTDWNASNPSDPCASASRAEFEDYTITISAPPSCVTPSALTVTNITPTSADLGWTDNAGVSLWDIEWGVSPYTATGIPTIIGTTTNPHNLTGLTANTSYEFYVRADCGGSGTSTWFGPYTFFTGYCSPSSSSASTYVDNFSTTNGSANISNLVSGFTTGGYFDGTAQAVQSYANGSFDFNAEIVGGTAGFSIWIDWNNDLVFDDLTEKEFNTTSYGNGPFIGTINIPGATVNGNYRMRITTDWNASNPSDPCASASRAEFEDYTLTIITQSANDLGVISIQSAPVGCGLGMETVTIQVKNYGTSTETGFDVIYSLNGTPITPETVSGSVLSGDTLTHVFTTMANMSTPAVYTIDAWSLLVTDADNSNDTLTGWTTEHLTSSLTYNGSAPISNTIATGTQTIICTNGLVNNMLDTCYELSALVIDSLPHTWETDIDMWLISPAGDTLEVSTDNGSGSGSVGYLNVTFTDTASTNIAGATNLTNGFFTTEEVFGLAKFNGTDPNGAWTLHVLDDAGGDDGILYKWHLEFTDNNFVVNLGADSNACSVDALTLNAGVGNYSYAWSTGESTQTISVDTTSLGGNGTYNISVTVTDTITGCEAIDTIIVNYSVCSGIDAISNYINLNVYPNPNNGIFTLNVNTTDVSELEIKVMNIQGQVVFVKNNFDNINTINEQIDLSNNANGIYFITITSDKGVKTHKVIIQ